MANKQYQSIIRLLQHSGVDIDAPLNVSRIKKLLNAEFDMSASGYLEADEFSYSKSEVFEELDRSDFENRFIYHRRIWNDRAILDLLEKNAFNYFDFDTQMRAYYNDVSFDQFFSPYFGFSFHYLSRGYLNEGRFDEMSSLLAYDEFMLHDEREEAFRPLRVFLDDSLRAFRNINAENYASFADEMRPWGFPRWSRMLNALPEELEDRKADIALYLVNVTVAIQRTKKSDCRFISNELVQVEELPEELRKLIKSNHKVYTGGSIASSKSGGISYWWIGWVVIVLLRVLSGC